MVPTPPVPGPGSGSRSMFPDLDAAYGRQLEAMAKVRRAAAAVATSRKKPELRLGQIQSETAEGESASSELTELRRQLAAARAEEQRMAEAGRRLQAKISTLHDAKTAVEAAFVAADETARAILAEVTGN
jgi:phage shock protein A